MWDLRTLAQFQGSEMSPGLFQDFMGIQNPLVVEHSVVVKTEFQIKTIADWILYNFKA